MRPPHFHPVTAPLLLALAYFVTGWLGLMLPAFGSHITLVWMPTGIAVAALFRWGWRCWPGITVGAFAVNLATGTPWPVALGIAAGNTAGPMLAAWMLRRIGFHPTFDRARDILLLAAGAALGMLVTSSLGVATLAAGGMLAPGTGITAWLTWWAGDGLGVIAAAPLVFTNTRVEWTAIRRRRLEFLIWIGATCLGTWAVFAANSGASGQPLAIAFLPLPFVAWAALRFGPVGTSLGLIILSVGAAYGTATMRGPFFRSNAVEEVTVLWLYMATSAVLGWLISALHTARVRASVIQRLLEQALSDVSLGVLMSGLDRRITYANHGFTRLTGYTAAELVGKSCALLQGPETDPGTVDRLKIALRGDGFFDGEILNYRNDGTTFWNGLLISPVHDESGAMTGFLGIQRDITKRKRAELALHQSEEHLRTIVELEPECVKLLSPDGTLLEMNPAGLAMIEAGSFEEVRGCPLTQLIVPEDRAAFSEVHRRAMQGAAGRCEFALVSLKGTPRWLETHAVPYRDARREIVGVLGITRDITQRRQSEARLRDSEERLRLAMSAARQGLYDLNVQTGECIVTPEYALMLGYDPAEFTETNAAWRERLHPDDRETVYGAYTDYVEGRREEYRVEFRQRTKNGQWKWILSIGSIVGRSADGQPLRMLGTHTDITELKLAERALATTTDLLERTGQMAKVGGWELDLQTMQLFWSQETCRIHEIEPPVAPALDQAINFYAPEARPIIAEAVQAGIEQGTPWDLELPLITASGRPTWVRAQGSAVMANGKAIRLVGVIQDITARRQAQIEREALDRNMQETQKLESLGVLAGGIAHDFNNLLTAILGNASIAQLELPPDSSAQDCLAHITEASLRAADLCKQMLAYSGRGRFVVQWADLGALVEQTAQMLQISISKKSVLRFRLEKELPSVEVDATQIRQVIMNLVINASEAIGDASGVISISTGLARVDRDYFRGTLMDPDLPVGDYVFLEVSDTGCGMDAETQARIFEPFFTTKFTGRGLGLAAVLGIVRGHKGAMKVYSEPGRGTTFKLLFPAAHGLAETLQKAEAAVPPWQGEGRVLVVDDEETMRTTVARMMRLTGLDPVLAADGREAVEIFRADPAGFAFVLLDLTMPHMDGEQTFTELRRLRSDVRVVLMSGFNAQEALGRFNGRGLSNFLQKPFTIESLRTVVRGVMS